jgi:hypothetical protein
LESYNYLANLVDDGTLLALEGISHVR